MNIPRTGIGQFHAGLLVLLILFLSQSITVEGNCAIGTIQTSYTVTEFNPVTLYCTTQGTERTQWYYGGTQLSDDCSGLQSPYSLTCSGTKKQYNLTFTATWAIKGTYTCACFTSSENVVVEVEIPIGSVTVTCTVESTGQSCADKALEETDMLIITATTSCTYPDPTFTWFKNQTTFDVSQFDLVESYTACSGDQTGQRIASQTFNVTWSALNMTSKLEVLVERSRAASVLQSVSFNEGLVFGFMIARIIGLIVGVACGVGGVTAGVIGLKRTLSRNAIKPKPQPSDDTETGEKDLDLTSVSE